MMKKAFGKAAAGVAVLMVIFVLSAQGRSNRESGTTLIWEWDYARDGWNFGGSLSNLPGMGDGSTTGLAAGSLGHTMNGMPVYARARPVVENRAHGGFQLGARGNDTVARLLIGGVFSGDTADWVEGGSNTYWEGTEPRLDLSRPVRITFTISHHQLHRNRALLIVRVNNNSGANANSPLGNISSIGQLNGSASFSGARIEDLPVNANGHRVFTVEYHPDRFRDSPGRRTLSNAYIGLQTHSAGTADGAGPQTENYIVISSIRIEYDDSIRARR